jgi:hypothetical protein
MTSTNGSTCCELDRACAIISSLGRTSGRWHPACALAGPFRRSGKIEVEAALLRVADELPVVGEAAAVAVAEVLENDLARPAEAGRHLEQLDEVLGGQAAGERFAGHGEGRKWREGSLDRQAQGRGDRGRPTIHFRPAGVGKKCLQTVRPISVTIDRMASFASPPQQSLLAISAPS